MKHGSGRYGKQIDHTGHFLPSSRGRISAPFPIENSHFFPNAMSVFSKKQNKTKTLLPIMRNNDPYQNDT